MTKYRITLKPVTPYFFGIEKVSELGNKKNYYLQSAFYPQQTAILGMLRYQILLQHNLLPIKEHKDEAKRLIGPDSFNPGNMDYGMIEDISPVQLCRDGDEYILRDKEFIEEEKEKEKEKERKSIGLLKREGWVHTNKTSSDAFLISLKIQDGKKDPLDDWTSKDEFVPLLVKTSADLSFVSKDGIDESKSGVLLESVVQSSGRVGIQKKWGGGTFEEAYYKQFFRDMTETEEIKIEGISSENNSFHRKLNSQWSFCFNVTWKDDSFDTNRRFVFLGGERSVFQLSAEKILEEKKVDVQLATVYKVLLLSDTYVEEEESFYDNVLFTNAETIRFRNLQAKVDKTQNYYARNLINKDRSGLEQSDAFYLLKRGSVFYTDAARLKTLEEIINRAKAFRKIGYNQYKIETDKFI